MTGAPFLTRWFALLDGDDPDGVLDLIEPDFRFSIVFSTASGATDFSGGRSDMVGYLAQRERGVLTHHRLAAATTPDGELFLGEVRRGGDFDATFVAAGRTGPTGKLRRLMIGRSPHTSMD